MDGDADAAVTARICSGWLQFRSLASFLTAKDFPCCCEEVYHACVHGSETSLKSDNELALHWREMEMIRWLCDVKLRNKLSCTELHQSGRRNSKSGPIDSGDMDMF